MSTFWLTLAAVCLILYVALSLTFLFYPNLIHKPKRIPRSQQVIAHRGGAGECLENTEEAFDNSVKVGATILEMDVRLTRDGKVVVFHDVKLQRACGDNRRISECHYKDLPQLKKTIPVTFYKGKETTGKDRHITLLRKVFERFPDVLMNIDIKENNEVLINKVIDMIEEFEREKITILASSNDNVVKRCCQKDDKVLLAFGKWGVMMVLLAFYTGLLPFLRLREDVFEIIMPSLCFRMFTPQPDDGWLQKKWFPPLFDMLLMNRLLFRHLKARGIEVYIFVLNQEEDVNRALRYGVTNIMTDYPSWLVEFYKKIFSH
uniref:GP-PDE domain-containing protein n=1 Tax=Eptatretus burgeri TaxID=7764 RepID=A0A8C4QHB7_EPTBU